MAKRQGISKKTRFEVFKRDSFTCQYCGLSAPQVILHVDHIQPVSKSGENDILNLITSCIDCNQGKKARLLSDDSVIIKQKNQLNELQERREQLEMMLEWRNGLKALSDDEVQAAVQACDSLTPGWTVNESGYYELRKLIKKFGLAVVLDAIEKSAIYLVIENNDFTEESVTKAFNKLGGICRVSQQPDWKRELYYIRGILRKRFSYCNQWKAMEYMEDAYNLGITLDELKEIACTSRNWTEWVRAVTGES